ncbi:6996_t:CDS:2 [Ambispora leptoticha]|uniref:6996_t:CDS:1 n=1 Tax=Ambispora leptoticha TaxID=144679 RepID=A0A9N9BPA6_9GLOM|nr:6996_t:CDS:2 [Ambispora leptoticha]
MRHFYDMNSENNDDDEGKEEIDNANYVGEKLIHSKPNARHSESNLQKHSEDIPTKIKLSSEERSFKEDFMRHGVVEFPGCYKIDEPEVRRLVQAGTKNANDDDEKKMNTENSSQDEVDDESLKFVLRPDDSQKLAESMIGKVERTALIVDDVDLDLEKTFEDYHNEYVNILEYFSD